ncbi:protein kinase domain-containing protein [Embleya sp. NBC_00896]|uniref:serine/threonine-protein kinase n=1 Tax=Embleya sp. NBC_00896 TaxID=2975961 RepID=UPI00386AB692|nr:serine/threonine-protein kinase [Embleya sp. NBC_00896]
MEQLDASDPQRVGPYVLLLPLGSGGMGKVYLGRSAAGRAVAVKVIRADFAADEHFRNRFRAEVAAARRVSGAFTAPVVDADPDGDPPWMATAFVSGLSLYDAVQRHGPLPEQSLRMLLAGLSEALVRIHAAGVVHRDLKPGNVLLALDGPHVIDFGIARALDGTSFTREGITVGSPGYMSPEQSLGRPITAASDLFALGSTMLYAASGQRPFGDGPPAAVLRRVVGDPADTARLPASIRAVVAACLDKDPTRRPTPHELIDFISREGAHPDTRSWLPEAVTRDVSRAADVLTGLPASYGVASERVSGQAGEAANGSAGEPVTAPATEYLAVHTATQAAEELTSSAPAPPGMPMPQSPPAPVRRQPSRRRLILGLVGGAGVAVSGGAAAILLSENDGSGKGAAATPSDTGPGSASPPAVPAPPPVVPHPPLPAPTGKKGVLDAPAAATKWTAKAGGPISDLAVYGGSVIATSTNGRDAFDTGAGRSRWTLPLGADSNGTGFAAGDDHTIYLTGTRTGTASRKSVLTAVQPGTGTELWTLPIPRHEWIPHGVSGIVDDTAFVTGRVAGGSAASFPKFVWAIDLKTRAGVWEAVGEDIAGLFVSPRSPDLLLHGDGEQGPDGQLMTLDSTRRGARGWNKTLPPPSTPAYATPIHRRVPVCWAGGGFVYCADKVYLVEPGSGKQVWAFPAGAAGESFTDCASDADGGSVFAATQTTLYCLDGKSGALRWRSSIPGGSARQPGFVTGSVWVRYDFGNVYVADTTGTLWAVDATTGTTRWKHPFPVPSTGAGADIDPVLAASAGTVLVGHGFQITAIDAGG